MEPGDSDTLVITALPQDQEGNTDKRPFKCRFCNYAATQRTHLRCHERTHTGEKPYKCNICGYAAAQKTNLNSHMRVHSGERPYKCKMCPYSAIQRSNLTSHYRAKHGVYKPTIYIEHDSPSRMDVDVRQESDMLSDIAAAHGIEQVQALTNTVCAPFPNHIEQSPGLPVTGSPSFHVTMNGNHSDVPASVKSYPARHSERTPSATSSVQGEEIMDLTCIKKEEETVVVSRGASNFSLDDSETYKHPDETSPTNASSRNVGQQRQVNESSGASSTHANYREETQYQLTDSPDKRLNASHRNQQQQRRDTQDSYRSGEISPHHQQIQTLQNNSYSNTVSGNTENRWTEYLPAQQHPHDEANHPSDDYQSGDSTGHLNSPQVQRQVSSQGSSPRTPTQRHMCQYCDISFGDYLMYTVHRGFHTYGDPLRCNMCGVKYRIPLEFFVHTHSGVHGSTVEQ